MQRFPHIRIISPISFLALAIVCSFKTLPVAASSHKPPANTVLKAETPSMSSSSAPSGTAPSNATLGKNTDTHESAQKAIPDNSAARDGTPLVDTALFSNPPDSAAVPDTVSRDLSAAIRNFHVVSPSLYRGAQPTEAGLAALQKAGVGTVVSFRNEPNVVGEENREAKKLGLNFVNIPMAVFEPIRQDQIDTFLTLVKQATKPVYCHCQFGQDRTGVMVAMYRMTQEGWSGDDALKEMLSYGFKPELLNYSNAVVACSRSLGRPATPPSQDYILADVKRRIGKVLHKNH